jgi:Ni/Fe-hydrogenase 1 B-type cytochrome subunit
MYERACDRVYVWELPVRAFHWVHVASVAVLAFTGYYIGNPFIVVPRPPRPT